MNAAPSLKQPKVEREEEPSGGGAPMAAANDNGNGGAELYREEQEEALVALIEHRTNEVEHLRRRITYYKSQLEEAERRLDETQLKLARLRGHDSKSAKSSVENGREEIEVSEKRTNRAQISEGSSQNQSQSRIQPRVEDGKPSNSTILKNVKVDPQSRSQLVIPAATPKISQPMKMSESGSKSASGSSRSNTLANTRVDSSVKLKGDKPSRSSSEHGAAEIQAKGTKRKFEQNEHKELIPLVRSCSTPCTIRCHTGCLISSQHKRKLRSLALCPTNDNLFVTSALDGVVNLWQIQGKGSMANLLSTTDCASQKQRRWPEDIAWHPQGNSLLAVYAADGGDSQISVMNLNKTKERTRVTFLEEKPHFKGIINNIVFMPWEETCFVTGGSDHAVILWTEKEGEYSWKQKSLHRSMHSSAVMGVAGMQQKHMVISVGADKRIIGFDVLAGRAEYKHQIESKCMSVLPNPCDFNLFMVQTGTPERQLRLFDIRLRQTELHTFGWKQESSESQSALINQAWSPDGLFITSGSADPMIHIFDIRFNAHKPSQSISAHQKRVFKAVWHHAYPLMVSISSDLNIGLHKIV